MSQIYGASDCLNDMHSAVVQTLVNGIETLSSQLEVIKLLSNFRPQEIYPISTCKNTCENVLLIQ